MEAALPPNEEARLAALRRYAVLDTGPEPQLDDIALLASRICGTPIALITLVDEKRQWFKSNIGLAQAETSREIAFCAHGILQAEPLVVRDPLNDPRFADNPLVTGDPRVRFYAGAPLITSGGDAVGMLCVMDQTPRELDAAQLDALQALSRQVIAQFELRRSLAEVRETLARLERTEGSLRLLASAVEQCEEAIVITEADLDFPGPRMVFVNPAYTAMSGYSAPEVLGSSPRILHGPRTDRAVLRRLREDLATGGTFEGETINYRKNGEEFLTEWRIAPVRDPAGETTHFVAVQRDITRRKRLEARFAEAQRLETVGKLAGGVAHEFNSIMTAIIGRSELLLGELPPEDRLRKDVAAIAEAADRAAALTRQLLAYGRKQILRPEIIDLNAVVAGMDGALRYLMGPEVSLRLAPAAGLSKVRADAQQIEQVVLNLAMNAADAMPGGGSFVIESGNVELDEEHAARLPEAKAGAYAVLTLTDSGAGMSHEVKARIFEPFFTTKGIGQGTGLGLSTCYGIVRQSGGHIGVYSEPGRGAMFKVYLPKADAETRAPARRLQALDLAQGGETILLVEDHSAMRDMAAALLRRLGYSVFAAANGLEALSLLEKPGRGAIDLLFTDIMMPQMNGQELSERIRVLRPATRILFTSTYTDQSMVHLGGVELGSSLLKKPYTPSDLARKIREVLDAPALVGEEQAH